MSFSNLKNNNAFNLSFNDSIYLTKILVIDTVSNQNDTSTYTFEYDVQQRLIKTYILKYNQVTNNNDSSYTFTYEYHGNDTMPVKVIEYSGSSSSNQSTLIHLLNYNSLNRLYSDSILLTNTGGAIVLASTSNYLYQIDGYIDSTYQYMNSQSYKVSRVLQSRNQENNIMSEIRTMSSKFSIDLAYDSLPNPLYKLSPVKEPYLLNKIFPCFINNLSPQKWNIQKATSNNFDETGTTVQTVNIQNYQITYGASGLPTTIRCNSNPSNYNDRFKYVFIYNQ